LRIDYSMAFEPQIRTVAFALETINHTRNMYTSNESFFNPCQVLQNIWNIS
jgi:hypothetical protein